MNAKPFELHYAVAARELVLKRYNQKITVRDLAETIGVGEKTLRRAFKKYYNQTIFSYQKQLRMEQALQLLQQGDKPVKQVARIVGYRNESSFSRLFRQYYGDPPSAWLGRDEMQL